MLTRSGRTVPAPHAPCPPFGHGVFFIARTPPASPRKAPRVPPQKASGQSPGPCSGCRGGWGGGYGGSTGDWEHGGPNRRKTAVCGRLGPMFAKHRDAPLDVPAKVCLNIGCCWRLSANQQHLPGRKNCCPAATIGLDSNHEVFTLPRSPVAKDRVAASSRGAGRGLDL